MVQNKLYYSHVRIYVLSYCKYKLKFKFKQKESLQGGIMEYSKFLNT